MGPLSETSRTESLGRLNTWTRSQETVGGVAPRLHARDRVGHWDFFIGFLHDLLADLYSRTVGMYEKYAGLVQKLGKIPGQLLTTMETVKQQMPHGSFDEHLKWTYFSRLRPEIRATVTNHNSWPTSLRRWNATWNDRVTLALRSPLLPPEPPSSNSSSGRTPLASSQNFANPPAQTPTLTTNNKSTLQTGPHLPNPSSTEPPTTPKVVARKVSSAVLGRRISAAVRLGVGLVPDAIGARAIVAIAATAIIIQTGTKRTRSAKIASGAALTSAVVPATVKAAKF